MRLDVEHGIPDIYIDGTLALAVMDAAFCRAFAAPPPGLFEAVAGRGDWIEAMARQAVGLCHRLDRAAFATKLDLFLPASVDVVPALRQFAGLTGCALALDLGIDTVDDRALLITPAGRLVSGLLEAIGPGREEGVSEVAFRPSATGT